MANLINYFKNINYESRFFIYKANSFSTLAVKIDQAKMNARSQSLKSFKEIPGPSSLPLLGPLHHFLPGGSLYKMNRMEVVTELHKQYGPIVKLDKILKNPTMIFLYDGESVGKIFKSENRFPRRDTIQSLEMYRHKYNKQKLIGNLLNEHGEEWWKHRSVLNPVMLPPQVVFKSYSKILDEIAEDAMDRLKSVYNEENGTIPDIDQELKLWSLETAGAITLGRRFNCFNRNLPENSYEKRLISLIQTFFDNFEKIDFKQTPFIFPGDLKKAMKTYEELIDISSYFLNETLTNNETKKNGNQSEKGIVEKICDIDKDVAMNIGVESMVAGVDSVSSTILGFWYFLGANREKQNKLRAEILSGSDSKSYLKACMKEASRIIPAVPGNLRITSKPYEILGYEIPKGVRVFFGHYEMCMQESNFPQAKDYIPERWLVGKDDPMSYKHASQFAHQPFGFGVRTCLGRRIAELTMEKLTTKMVANFDITWNGPAPEIVPSTFAKIKKPYRFVFKKI